MTRKSTKKFCLNCNSTACDHVVNREFPHLTERLIDVVELAFRGLNTEAIADELGLTNDTVKVYFSNIYERLGLNQKGYNQRVLLTKWYYERRNVIEQGL